MTQHSNPYQQPPAGRPQQDHSRPDQPPRKSGGCLKYTILGCLGVTVLAIVIVVVISIVAYRSARTIGAGVANKVTSVIIEDMQLPADQKQRIKAQLDRVTDAVKEGRLDFAQMNDLFSEIQATPVASMGMVYLFESQHLRKSGLPAEEKADAQRQMERLARAVYERRIDESQAKQLSEPLMEEVNGRKRMKQQMSDAEIRDFINRIKPQVEALGIPDEPFQVDMAKEIESVVDNFLQKHAKPKPAK